MNLITNPFVQHKNPPTGKLLWRRMTHEYVNCQRARDSSPQSQLNSRDTDSPTLVLNFLLQGDRHPSIHPLYHVTHSVSSAASFEYKSNFLVPDIGLNFDCPLPPLFTLSAVQLLFPWSHKTSCGFILELLRGGNYCKRIDFSTEYSVFRDDPAS